VRPIPAGRLVGASLAALLASAAAARAAVADVTRAAPVAPLTLAGRGAPHGVAGAARVSAAGGASLRAEVAPAEVVPGARVIVRGHGFPAHARVTALVAGRFAGHARATRRGRFVMRAVTPALAPGVYALRLRAHGVRLHVRLRVTAGATPRPPPGAVAPETPAAPGAPPGPVTAPGPPRGRAVRPERRVSRARPPQEAGAASHPR